MDWSSGIARMAPIVHPLVFLIAPLAQLPKEETSWAALSAIQSPNTGFSLRLFSAAETEISDLAGLPWDGQLDPGGGGERRRLICDAVIPHFDPEANAIGVYQRSPNPEVLRCLDRFMLQEAANETCWFYPTHDGHFLSWEREEALSLEPGVVASEAATDLPESYERSQIALLWSLLADDESLTCVGLTYGGQRLEWGQRLGHPAPEAHWSLFSVDTEVEVSLTVNARQAVQAS